MNIWEHGEKCHPGIVSLARALLMKLGTRSTSKHSRLIHKKPGFITTGFQLQNSGVDISNFVSLFIS